MTTGEERDPSCYECNPEAFVNDDRPKVLMYMCQHHLSLVEPVSEEVLREAIEQGKRDKEAYERANPPTFLMPSVRFR